MNTAQRAKSLSAAIERIHTKRLEAKPPGIQVCSVARAMEIVRERIAQPGNVFISRLLANSQRNKPPVDLSGFISTEQAAEILGCAENTVRRWAHEGIFEKKRGARRRLFYKKSDVVCHARARVGGKL